LSGARGQLRAVQRVSADADDARPARADGCASALRGDANGCASRAPGDRGMPMMQVVCAYARLVIHRFVAMHVLMLLAKVDHHAA
jgi:hypothetical protein